MTTPEFTTNRDNYCYRHPDRQSFVLCQRCMRTICPECQTQAAVGVICPECMKDQRRAQTPAQRKAARRWIAPVSSDDRPIVTYAILAVTAVVGVLQLIPGLGITSALLFSGVYVMPQVSPYPFEPWRLLTALLVHGGFWHFGLNMLALWMIGRVLEPMLGRWRFLALYLIGGLGGSVAVAAIAPMNSAVGASGAVFALMAALLVIGRQLGGNVTGILVVLGINLVLGFIIPGIAWQAHLGGAAIGALVGFILARTSRREQRAVQILLLIAVVVVVGVLLAVVPPLVVTAMVGG